MRAFVAGCLLALAWVAPVAAQEDLWPIQPGGELETVVGSGIVVTLPAPLERIAVGDDSLAATHVLTGREILVQGLVPGRTTLYVWLTDGRRILYELRVAKSLDVVRKALADLDPDLTIENSADGESVLLRGEVDDERTALQAQTLVETLLGTEAADGPRLVSFVRYPGATSAADVRLGAALWAIDPRIRLRRIQVGAEPDNQVDALVLEGRVRDVSSLTRAMSLCELQLGGIGGKIEPTDDQPLDFHRQRGFTGTQDALQGSRHSPRGLSSQVARGQLLKSASGRVLSFLEVDELPQVLVSIRVLEIDRGKARRVGVDYRIDGEHFSLGSYHRPGSRGLPVSADGTSAFLGANYVGAWVDDMLSIAAAVDFLEERELARSVAEPNITTLSGEQATVLVGGEVPIPTTTVGQVTSVQGYFFQDFGVRLDIRPTLTGDGLVALEVAPSIVRPAPGLSVGGVPGFEVQTVQTTARVALGHSLVIGGLLSFEEGLEQRGVPGLQSVPVIKHLFRWREKRREEQELLFVITPRSLLSRPEPTPAAPAGVTAGEPGTAETPPPPEPAPAARAIAPRTEEERIELPPLDWPEDRDGWHDEFEPGELTEEGLPPSFGITEAPRTETPRETEVEPAVQEPSAEPEVQAPPAEPTTTEETPAEETAPPPKAPAPPPAAPKPPPVVLHWRVLEYADPCVDVRPTRDPGSEPLACLEAGSSVEVLRTEEEWRRVRLPDGREGWMDRVFLVPDLDAVPWAVRPGAEPCLDLRASPQAEADSLTCVRPGSRFALRSRRDGWLEVTLDDGRPAWAPAPSLAPHLGDRPWHVLPVARPCLRFREEPELEDGVIDCLPPGTAVRVLDRDGEWLQIERVSTGREGWSAGAFLGP